MQIGGRNSYWLNQIRPRTCYGRGRQRERDVGAFDHRLWRMTSRPCRSRPGWCQSSRSRGVRRVVDVWRGAEAAVALSVAGSAPSLDQIRVWDIGEVSGGSGEPRALCPSPHLPFYGAMRRGPPTMERLDAPISA